MKRAILFRAIACCVLALFSSCGEEVSTETEDKAAGKSKLEPLNIVLVLDLSNRLVKTPGQGEKDQEVIQSILEIFEERQKRQAFITSKDLFQVVVAPQPNVPTATNDSLRIDMRNKKKKGSGGKALIGWPKYQQERETFKRAVKQIYEQALQEPFTGADIYTFFCTELPKNFTVAEAKTKVIVLTDGYLEFDRQYLSSRPACTYMQELDKMRAEKDRWEQRFKRKELALCPCQGQAFQHTEVLMLETAPLFKGTSVYEFPMIEHYWKTWFDAMGLPAEIEPHDNMVAGIKGKVKAFLQ